ncbi:MAG: protein-L-isoaspartate O-methyltransferase [Tetrasphaera sp.]
MPVSSSARVRSAFAATGRTRFLPADQVAYAAADRPLPIGHGQTNSQPRTVADMLTALDVRPGQRVLDVGSGSGWTTALLAWLVGPQGSVLGVERVPELVIQGRANLASLERPWARIEAAREGVLGWPQDAAYDRILVSAEARRIPPALLEQLASDGLMVIPVHGHLLSVFADGTSRDLGRYIFVPLIDPE